MDPGYQSILAANRAIESIIETDDIPVNLKFIYEGEEEIVLAAQQKLLKTHSEALLVLVPRHPQRFAAVRDLIVKQGMGVVSRTDSKSCSDATQVFLGDTMGELTLFYAASDVAFVAGSLVPIGGHNLLEPAALGLPLLSGPHVFNAQDIADMFVAKGACKLVHDSAELAAAVDELLSDPETASVLGEAGREILERNRGALDRLMAMIEPLVN